MSGRQVVFPGDRYGRLVVIEYAGSRKGQREWRCRCDCGTEGVWPTIVLRTGTTRSCGCLRQEMLLARITKHGLSKTPAYSSWKGMVHRCTNPKHSSYGEYGGRGIIVCDRWNPHAGGLFENFLADMGERPSGKTLDRIDNDGDYEPGNCRWVTPARQAANRRLPPGRLPRVGRRIAGWRCCGCGLFSLVDVSHCPACAELAMEPAYGAFCVREDWKVSLGSRY